jgi:signal peptidase I
MNTKKIIKSVLEWIIYALIFVVIVWGTPKLMVRLLHTEYPIASITSSSMWPELKEGDVVFIRGVGGKADVKVGDVVVYRNERGFTIHRIIAMNDTTLTTKGDANNVDDAPIKYEQLVGKMITYGNNKALRIPWLGKLSQMRK